MDNQFSGQERKLADAAGRGDAAAVAELIEQGADPNAYADDGMPLLLYPVARDSLPGFRALLDHGANINARAANHEILMHYIVQGASAEFVAVALEHGADPDATNKDKEPLVHIARRAGNWDSIERLLDAGADIDSHAFGVPGSTLLFQVSGRGDFQRVHWLMERGADPGLERITAAGDKRQPVLEQIFHRPVDAGSNPEAARWQEKCQQWVLEKGYSAPPVPRQLDRDGGSSTAS